MTHIDTGGCSPGVETNDKPSSAPPAGSNAGHVTTDEWADLHPLFKSNVDAAIKYIAGLEGEEAYTLRRHVMIYARQEFDSV